MKSLGVSMIVKNESECIEACLESIKGVDEIVIVDTGSEDNTVELCKKYTDKVYTDYSWQDDFSEARNVSLSHCTADWILIIDADEVLKCSIEGLRHVLNSYMAKNVEGHTIRYMGMLFAVHTGVEIVESIRIIKNDPSIKWEGAVHNSLTLDGNNEHLKNSCYKSKFEIASGYSPAHFKDPNRSLRILTKQLELNPDNTRYQYYMAREYIARRMNPENKDQVDELLDKIIFWLEKYDAIAFHGDWTNELADALYLLALAYFEKVMVTKDISWWHKGFVSALKSFAVLPSYQAPAKLLCDAMLEIPGSKGMVKYRAAHEFWQLIASKCSNAGVAQLRKV
jgi:glycosyltransferase involved in cell wall biosynthesis